MPATTRYPQIILHTDGILCGTTTEVASSRAFHTVLNIFLDHLIEKEDALMDGLGPDIGTSEGRSRLMTLLRHLSETPCTRAVKAVPGAKPIAESPRTLHRFVEKFYDFWRSVDRYLICHSEQVPHSHDTRPFRTFTVTAERLRPVPCCGGSGEDEAAGRGGPHSARTRSTGVSEDSSRGRSRWCAGERS